MALQTTPRPITTAVKGRPRSMHPSRLAHRSSGRRSAGIAPTIKRESEADTLQFRCPNSGRTVDSGISTRRGARLISIRIQCPVCENLHEWRVADGNLAADLSADHQSNGARLNKAQTVFQDFQGPGAEIIKLRDQLLDEFHHRLKNNLQVLYGLLNVAWRKTENSGAREVLLDTCRRVGAMGSAQQAFYSARSSTDISGQSFLEAVCANARAFFSNDVSVKCDATTGFLPKETAMPLALVLNELLTNAVKYGADDRGQVTIDVRLSQRPGEIELSVQDYGAGFDFEEGVRRSSGLGLVTMLARRVNGTFLVERKSGARCTLRFPDQ
jgi:two-component sensor histidine kinase